MALTVFMVRYNSLELKAWVHQERTRAYVCMYVCMYVCLKTVINLPFKHTYTVNKQPYNHISISLSTQILTRPIHVHQ